jgi:hypothetical protein
MFGTRIYHYRDPAGVALGLRELRKHGLTPRGLMFIAVDPRGETYIAIADDPDRALELRVGDKLTIAPPFSGRYFYFDAIHRLPGDTVLYDGDRRLGDTGSAPEIACAVAHWLKGSSAKNVFLGCTPHQWGSWWCKNERSHVTDLHAAGFVSGVVATSGILCRRIGEPQLFHLSFADLRDTGARRGWTPVYRSPFGNILMLERRILNYRLVLTCERGLVELDVSGLPEVTAETAHVQVEPGIGIVGRIDGEGFAVTRGRVEPWGLADVTPAVLVGSPNQSILDLPAALAATAPARRERPAYEATVLSSN